LNGLIKFKVLINHRFSLGVSKKIGKQESKPENWETEKPIPVPIAKKPKTEDPSSGHGF
jgi:hypothetical protein